LRTSTWSAYPVEYTTELDDARAGRIADRLRAWSAALFRAVFGGDEALMVWTPPSTASMCQGGGVEQPPGEASMGHG
jgi:hypothetical protein